MTKTNSILIQIIYLCLVNAGIPGRITVPTGKVAVFYKNRKLLPEISHGPVIYYDPIFSESQLIDVQSQKDSIGSFQCVAKDDQMVTFPRIDVTNQLPEQFVIKVISKFEKFYDFPPVPYDKILIIDETISFIKELCTQMTGEELRKEKYETLNEVLLDHLNKFQKNRPELLGEDTGIQIRRVFIETPTLDPRVEANRREIAIQKTAKQAEEYRQLTELKRKETENKLAELEAEKQKNIETTRNLQKIEGQESQAKQNKIKVEAETNEIRMRADANSYAALKQAQDKQFEIEAESKALKDAPEYLRKLQLEAFGCQNKVYWGNDLPDVFLPGKSDIM
jgi:erlin